MGERKMKMIYNIFDEFVKNTDGAIITDRASDFLNFLRQSIINDIKEMRESISYEQIPGTTAVRVGVNFCQPLTEHYKILYTIKWLMDKFEITEEELK